MAAKFKKPATRPWTLPESARWDKTTNVWVDSARDEEGRLHGPGTSYRPDGTLCVSYVNHAGVVHGDVTRYHDSGDIAQGFHMANGKFHGTRTWYFTDEPTQEAPRPEELSDVVKRTEMVYDHGDVLEIRHFDGGGRRVTHEGKVMELRPVGLPEDAWKDPRDGLWKTGRALPDGKVIGPWKHWHSDGALQGITEYGPEEKVLRMSTFHIDASIALEVDFEAGTGRYCAGPVAPRSEPIFVAEGASEVRFVPHVNEKTPWSVWPLQPRYFTAEGEELVPHVASDGPPLDAEAVTRGQYRPTLLWRNSKTEGPRKKTTYWRKDGTVAMRATYTNGALVRFDEHDETGHPRIAETFSADTGEAARPIPQRTVVETNEATVTYDYDSEGLCTMVTRTTSDGEITRIDNEPESLSAEAFFKAFDRRFAEALSQSTVSLWFESCTVMSLDGRDIQAPFAATALTADGGGNFAILIDEGKHAGRVFFFDHEEGLLDLDEGEVTSFLEEEGYEVASADEAVEAMPFFESPLATSAGLFLRGITVGSQTTCWQNLSYFKPLL